MTARQPPLIVQPTFGHPYCDRCGAVIVEEAKQRHVEWHELVEAGREDVRPSSLLAQLRQQRQRVQEAVAPQRSAEAFD